jgi:redox-sensitive bicupin YhaK (pirin superfamily)
MTMLNAAPTATSVPAGTGSAAAAPQAAPNAAPAAARVPAPSVQHHPTANEPQAKDPEFHVLGSGGTAGATGVAQQPGTVTIPLDQFAKQSGPDASVQTAGGVVSVHAVFQLDAKTRELSVAIVNEDGQLVRMIPPDSVARMIAAMATYRGR